MSRFVILLGGTLTVTPRLRAQVENARIIAADSGMTHAAPLGLDAELWVGDFDSTSDALAGRYSGIAREVYPADKAATDGEIAIEAAIARGASEFVLVGGFGGQADHTFGHAGLVLALAMRGFPALLTSGTEEAHPLLPGEHRFDLPAGTRLSIVPFADLTGLDLENVKWPLHQRSVPLGSSLTLSNIALGPVRIGLGSGYGLTIAYPGA
ncbi:MAG: thiamine diphosphokinase [Rhizobiales bacterium]|nr:thiamine diphosphokinase [Hyphomicrobiales bacterium]